MNHADGSPQVDEQFETLLAEYDEALAAHTPHGALTTVSGAALQERLAGAQRCLRLLHRRWPRAAESAAASDSDQRPTFGRFLIERELGRGGFGIVYLAFDPVLQRQVALKLPRPEVLAGSDAHRRFIREGQTAARLHHPNLVAILEAGEVGLVCYLASEYCPGPTLSAWRKAKTSPIDPRLAAKIVQALADAVGYLHEQGVVHRDIKPGNVLLENDVPKLTDFGLAKSSLGDSLHTRTGSPLGTPAYMAPEQAGGANAEAGPPADVYSLGVVLYELVAGQNPFAGATDVETYRRHLVADAPPLRASCPVVPRDLEAVCLKCVEKSPSRRYASGRDLAEDLRRFLAGEPTHARPLASLERLSRWSRKHPAVAVSLAFCMAALVAFAGVASWHASQMDAANRILRERQSELLEGAYVHDFNTAFEAAAADDHTTARKILARYEQSLPGVSDPRGIEWQGLVDRVAARNPAHVLQHASRIWSIDVSPDGRCAATSEKLGIIRLWNLATGQELRQWQGHSGEAQAVRFLPDGKTLASSGQDGMLKLWQAGSGAEIAVVKAHEISILAIAISPDGRNIVTGSRDGSIRIWNCQALLSKQNAGVGGDRLVQLSPLASFAAHDVVYNVSFLPGGTTIAAGTAQGLVLFDYEKHEEVHRCFHVNPKYKFFAASPVGTGSHIALAGYQRTGTERVRTELSHLSGALGAGFLRPLWVYDSDQRKTIHGLQLQADSLCMNVSSDRKWLAAGGTAGMVSLFHFTGPSLEHVVESSFQAHEARVEALRISPDGQWLLTGSDDQTVKVWPVAAELRPSLIRHLPHRKRIHDLVYTRDGHSLCLASEDGNSFQIEIAPEIRILAGPSSAVECSGASLSREGDLVVQISSDEKRVTTYERDKSSPLWSVDFAPNPVNCVCQSADGRKVAVAFDPPESKSELAIFDSRTGQPLISPRKLDADAKSISFSHRGNRLAIGMRDVPEIHLLDLNSAATVVLRPGMSKIRQIVFSDDDRLVAAGCWTGQVFVFDVGTGRLAWTIRLSDNRVDGLAFSPDNRLLCATYADGFVTIFHLSSQQVLVRQDLSPFVPGKAVFSPDNQEVACAVSSENYIGQHGVIRIPLGP